MNITSTLLDHLPRPFIIFGMGITGKSIRRLLLLCQIPAHDIWTYDEIQVNQKTKEQILSDQKNGTLIVSPGISLADLFVQNYLHLGGTLTSELEIAFSFLNQEKIISITGSLGKSTTSALIFEGLKTCDPNAFLGGNFGIPLADYVSDLLEKRRGRAKFIVLELSSYQLENFKNLKSTISVLTYLSKNHMDRYDSLNDYYNTKLTLIYKTAGLTICNKNGGDLFQYLSHRPFPLIQWTDRHSPIIQKYALDEAQLIGSHNQDNIAMASVVLENLSAGPQAFLELKKYKGLPHRLENLGQYENITFINDSKATTIDSVREAILNICESFPQQNIHILLGGKDKGLPWENLSQFQNIPHLFFYFFGACRDLAKNKSALNGPTFFDLCLALDHLRNVVKKSDVVLLSPGGTSLDEFSSFEDRGQTFKNEILKRWSYSARSE